MGFSKKKKNRDSFFFFFSFSFPLRISSLPLSGFLYLFHRLSSSLPSLSIFGTLSSSSSLLCPLFLSSRCLSLFSLSRVLSLSFLPLTLRSTLIDRRRPLGLDMHRPGRVAGPPRLLPLACRNMGTRCCWETLHMSRNGLGSPTLFWWI